MKNLPWNCRNLIIRDEPKKRCLSGELVHPRVHEFMDGALRDPSRELLSRVDFEDVQAQDGIGPKGIQRLIEYLAEGGLAFKNQPKLYPATGYAIMGEQTMSTSHLCKKLGFNVSVNFLKDCGVSPLAEHSQGVFWRTSDFQIICHAIARRLERLAASN